MQQFNTNIDTADSKVNLTEQLYRYIKNWKWFLLSILLSLTCAYIYLRYQLPQYGLTTTVLIKDDKKGAASEIDAFSDLGILGVKKSNLENEIEMFNSRRLTQNTVKELKFNVVYYAEGRILTPELYDDSPIELVFEKEADAIDSKGEFHFKYVKENTFEIAFTANGNYIQHQFGDYFDSPVGRIMIKKVSSRARFNNAIIIKISPILNSALRYKNKLNVKPLGEKTTIIELSVVDPVQNKGIDYLNNLVYQFNEDALNDKNLVAKNTQDFINERLNIITGELDTVERSAERFKKENRLTDLVTDAGLNLTTSSEYEKAIVKNGKELKVVEIMLPLLKNSSYDQTLPQNIIPAEDASYSMINQYNTLVLTRNNLLKSTSPNHPNVLNYNQQIIELKATILQTLKN